MLFRDRVEAGQQLAERLAVLKGDPNVVVLGIPRGGVVVAAEVARALGAPLDVLIAHKIGAPGNPEFAIGAITNTGQVWLDEASIAELKITRAEIEREVARWKMVLEERVTAFRSNRPPRPVKDKTVVIVDDGIATGSTLFAAVRALRQQEPAQLIVAVPVGPAETIARLRGECDSLVALATPWPFVAVGRFYRYFDQVEDSEVIALLRQSDEREKK